MKHATTRLVASLLAVLMCLGMVAVAVTAILPILPVEAAAESTAAAADYDFDENICISIFWPPTPEYITDEQYKLIAEAGVTWVMGAGEETLATPENQKKMLELCEKYGLGMTVSDGNFGDNLLNKSESQIASYVSKYDSYASAAGFYIRDEPFNPNAYIDAYIALKKAAPYASMHLNFLPQGSYGSADMYRAQMNDWCVLTAAAGYPIEYLMFDSYPFGLQAGSMNRSGFFANARSCWEIGLRNGVKTGMYIQAVQQDVAFRRPTASEIRYEMYAALAFGYKQLSFFTWFTPVNRSEPFSDGIIAADGTPNEHYYDIKEINHEILAIGKTLVKCDALEVWFNGPDTYGQPSVPDDFFVQAERRNNVILSYLRHNETGRNYLMVVNNNYSVKQKVTLTFDDAITSLSEVSREDGTLKALAMDGQELSVTLAAGDAMLIALPEGYDYLEEPTDQPSADTNLAAIDGATILCPTSVGADGWYIYGLNDGYRIAGGETSVNGWRSNDTSDTYILIDLGRRLSFNRIDLYAAGSFFDYGDYFPSNVQVSVSDDGETFNKVKSFTDLTAGALQGNTLSIDMQTARYIRLDITGMTRSDRYAALNEIEVYCDDGQVPAPEKFTLTTGDVVVDYTEGENIALGKNTFASSTTPDTYKQWGWAQEYINDGSDKGWTSNVGRNQSANATEYIGIDFGDVFALDRVVVRPGGAFPVNYSIDVSVDGVEWTVISKVTGAASPTEDVVLTLDTPVNARFLRMTATKLRSGGNAADGYLFQLNEIEAYGTPVCDKTDLQAAIDIYKTEGGDESAQLYINALAAMDNALLTQTRADDYAAKLLAAVGWEPETETESESESETESATEAESATDTLPVTETDTESASEVDTDTSSSSETGTEPTGGCASAVGVGAAMLLLAGGAILLRRRREN